MYFYLYIAAFIFIAWLLRKFVFNSPVFTKKRNLSGKTCIVTGSSAGIGKEIAFDLLANGAHVVFACRDEKKTMGVIATVENSEDRARAIFLKLDLCKVDSIINFTQEFRKLNRNIDILVNNAGLIVDGFILAEGIESGIMANHVGHKILTIQLLDKFSKDEARIVNLSSYAHHWADYTVEELISLQIISGDLIG